MKKIEITISNDEQSISDAIRSGITTPDLVYDWLDGAGVDMEHIQIVDGAIVLEANRYHADDGNAEVTFECDSGEDAAKMYVDGGDWGQPDSTMWVTVWTWREGIDSDGDYVRVEEDSYKIAIDPDEPDCTHGDGHEWDSPIEIVGGIKENPGVWGHGGGVKITEVCLHCGCERVTNTWAQDPTDGEQGLRSVSYTEGKYADEVSSYDPQ